MKDRYFRIRPITEYTLDALINDYVVASTLDKFNDPYDGYLTFDMRKLKHKLDIGDNALKIVYSYPSVAYKTSTGINLLSEIRFTEMVNRLLKTSFLVASFTRKINNPTMWAHYGQGGKGFAIEYDKSTINTIQSAAIDIMERLSKIDPFEHNYNDYIEWKKHIVKFDKVEYTTKSKNMTDQLYNNCYYVNSCLFDKLDMNLEVSTIHRNSFYDDFLSSFIFTKDSLWRYESESRLAIRNYTNKNDSHVIVARNTKPTAIYIGEFTPKPYVKILCVIADRKNIPIYRMMTMPTQLTNKLSAIKLSKDEILQLTNL